MATDKNTTPVSNATLTDVTDASKGADTLAHEATETIEIVVAVPKLLFEKVMAYKLRDVLPFTPAIKRASLVEASANEIVNKYFVSLDKGIDSAISMKQVKAAHPELFKRG